MKKGQLIWMVAALLAIVSVVGPAFAAKPAAKKVVVISGVSKVNANTVSNYLLVYEGIREGLNINDIVPEFQFVELDSLATDDLKKTAGASAIATARASNPDIIVTLNDDCLKFVGSRIDDLPVVFAWIWGKPETLGLPKANITGVIRRSYAADIWTMTRKLTGAKSVTLISKKSASMEGVRQYLTAGADKLEEASGVRFKDMYLVDTFAEWENCVKNLAADFLYMADTSRIVKDKHEMTDADLVRWTVDNTKVPVIGADVKSIQAGALFSIVTSEKAIGLSAAETVLKILNGAKPSDIPYVSSGKGKFVVNAKTAQKYGLDIPYDILATAEEVFE